MLPSKVITIFEIVKWSFYFSLCGVSTIFMKEVLEKYFSKATTYKVSQEELRESPAVTICPQVSPEKIEELQIYRDYDIHFGIGREENYKGMKLKIGNNSFEGNLIELETKLTANDQNCFTVLPRFVSIGDWAAVDIIFNDSYPEEKIPSLQFYVTSENNAFGVVAYQWEDGEALSFEMDRYTVAVNMQLYSEKYSILKSKHDCREVSFYECIGTKMYQQDISHCPKKCVPDPDSNYTISLPKKVIEDMNLPWCETQLERECVGRVMKQFWFESKKQKCPRPCSHVQYKSLGKSTEKATNDINRNFTFAFMFLSYAATTVHQEYYIFDEIGMISSVGGTLGMFIGVSFNNVISAILDAVKTLFLQHSN